LFIVIVIFQKQKTNSSGSKTHHSRKYPEEKQLSQIQQESNIKIIEDTTNRRNKVRKEATAKAEASVSIKQTIRQ